MVRQTGIGIQDFSKIIENNCFYVDKTAFIREWWESRDGLRPIGPIPVPTAWWESLSDREALTLRWTWRAC